MLERGTNNIFLSLVQFQIQYSLVNSEILLIQTGDYGPMYLYFIFKANSSLEHLIIRADLVGSREFELSGQHCILKLF